MSKFKKKNILKLYKTPKEVKYCKSCVISNQRPRIIFNKDGVCNACLNMKNKFEINWAFREKELKDLLSRYRKKNGKFDVIVPSSGGKDSAYTAHILKYKYGLNPLTVTWAPHLYTDIGWHNFQNWSHVGGLDNILFTPNGKLHRTLTKLAFNNLLHPFQPFIIGQRLIGPNIASKFGIKYVFYGENQAEYGNDIKDNEKEVMKEEFYSEKNNEENLYGGLSKKDILKQFDFKNEDFLPYLPLDKETINSQKIEVHYLGYYLKWDPQECYYYAAENTGFMANTERTEGSYSKYSSIDDKIDPFHYYTTLIKFGIGRATYDAAQEIRNNKITREEGINLVKLYDQEFPKKYFKEFLQYIDINEREFFDTVDKFRSPHLWSKDLDGKWKLKHNVSKTGIRDTI